MRASVSSWFTNASSALRTILRTSSAILGRSISGFSAGSLKIAFRVLGNIDGLIAHSLEIRVDLHDRDDQSKIGGHRRLAREQVQAGLSTSMWDLLIQVFELENLVEAFRFAKNRACVACSMACSTFPPMERISSFSF